MMASLVGRVISATTWFGGQWGMYVRRPTSSTVGASKGTCWVIAWYKVPARLYMSERKSALAPDLLGGDVVRRSHTVPSESASASVRRARPKSTSLGSRRHEEDVPELDIPVEEPVFEGRVQGGGHLDADIEHIQLREAAPFEASSGCPGPPAPSPGKAALPLLKGVQMDDVGVVELGTGPCLLVQASMACSSWMSSRLTS
jgi:hypothetical protein